MKFKAVIFDLDGTLVNSLHDIADSMNIVLENNNFPTHSYEAYQYFIGSGIRNLVSKALPLEHNNNIQIEHCFNAMMEVYAIRCTEKTIPYEGIMELLDSLIARNIKLSVLSNKADAFTKQIAIKLFPNYFAPIIGLTTELLKKPNPTVLLQMCDSLGFKPQEVMYVGDTGIDMQTATNAHMCAVGVLWGYRSKEDLIANDANYIISKPMDLIELL